MSSLEKYHDNFYELVFSILYLVKSLRNADITNITYIENVDYNDSNFQKKIFMVNEIIYVTGGGIRGFKDTQKWRVVQFYDNNGVYLYDIEPYNENGTPTRIKQSITPDRMRSIDEDKTTVTSDVFREKYENKFLLCVIYLCFVYCLMTEDIKDSLMDTFEFNKLMNTVISENMYLFDDLSFFDNLKEKMELIMVTIQKSILKQFNIDSDKLIGLMNYDPKKLMTLLGNYKLQFTKQTNTNNTKLKTDLYKYYESCDIFKLPELPTKFQVLYNNNTKSNDINLFNILCTAFNIEPDAMLSVVRYNLNNTLNDINNFISNKSNSLTGLNMEEIKQERVNIPNVFNINNTMRAGKKKIRKTKNKKKYKGGIVLSSSIGASALLKGTFYIAAGELAKFTAAGFVAVGSGLSFFGTGTTVLMTTGAAATTTTAAAAAATCTGGVCAATGAAGMVAAAPLVLGAVALTAAFVYVTADTPEQAVLRMYDDAKTMLEKLKVLQQRKAMNVDLYDFEVKLEEYAAKAMQKAEEEVASQARYVEYIEYAKDKDKEKDWESKQGTYSIQYNINNKKKKLSMAEEKFIMAREKEELAERMRALKKEMAESKIAFEESMAEHERAYQEAKAEREAAYQRRNLYIEPYSVSNPPTPTNTLTYTQLNNNLLDYNNKLPTSPNNMDPIVPAIAAVIGLGALAYMGVKFTKAIIGAFKGKKEEIEKEEEEEEKEEEEEEEEEEIRKKEEEEIRRKEIRKKEEKRRKQFNPFEKDYSKLTSHFNTSNSNTSNSNMSGLNQNWDPYINDFDPRNGYAYRLNAGGKKIRRTKRKKYNKK